jgi:hypothetical protein
MFHEHIQTAWTFKGTKDIMILWLVLEMQSSSDREENNQPEMSDIYINKI